MIIHCDNCDETRADEDALWCQCGECICSWCAQDEWGLDVDGEPMCPDCVQYELERVQAEGAWA